MQTVSYTVDKYLVHNLLLVLLSPERSVQTVYAREAMMRCSSSCMKLFSCFDLKCNLAGFPKCG